jgi:hypothetical protein
LTIAFGVGINSAIFSAERGCVTTSLVRASQVRLRQRING